MKLRTALQIAMESPPVPSTPETAKVPEKILLTVAELKKLLPAGALVARVANARGRQRFIRRVVHVSKEGIDFSDVEVGPDCKASHASLEGVYAYRTEQGIELRSLTHLLAEYHVLPTLEAGKTYWDALNERHVALVSGDPRGMPDYPGEGHVLVQDVSGATYFVPYTFLEQPKKGALGGENGGKEP